MLNQRMANIEVVEIYKANTFTSRSLEEIGLFIKYKPDSPHGMLDNEADLKQ